MFEIDLYVFEILILSIVLFLIFGTIYIYDKYGVNWKLSDIFLYTIIEITIGVVIVSCSQIGYSLILPYSVKSEIEVEFKNEVYDSYVMKEVCTKLRGCSIEREKNRMVKK